MTQGCTGRYSHPQIYFLRQFFKHTLFNQSSVSIGLKYSVSRYRHGHAVFTDLLIIYKSSLACCTIFICSFSRRFSSYGVYVASICICLVWESNLQSNWSVILTLHGPVTLSSIIQKGKLFGWSNRLFWWCWIYQATVSVALRLVKIDVSCMGGTHPCLLYGRKPATGHMLK